MAMKKHRATVQVEIEYNDEKWSQKRLSKRDIRGFAIETRRLIEEDIRDTLTDNVKVKAKVLSYEFR